MAKNNDVFSIIPIQNSSAVLTAGQTVNDLAVNEIGVFDYETGISLDAGTAAGTKKFFIAMAVDTDGDGLKDEIITSAGTHVQSKNVTAFDSACPVDELPQIVDVQNFTASCDTQYALKVEINSDEKYMNYGFNQLTKTFVVKTSCCDGCETCPTGDCVELTSLMIAEINNDDDNLILASAVANAGSITFTSGAVTATGNITVSVGTDVFSIAVVSGDTVADVAAKVASAITASSKYVANSDAVDTVSIVLADGSNLTAPVAIIFADTDTTGVAATTVAITTTPITDLAAFGAANPGACPNIRLTTVPSAVKKYCDINTQYYKQRMPILTVSFAQANSTSLGFDCNGTIVEVQPATFSQGLGYDLAQIEYQVGGFIGKPGVYRTGDMLGVAFNGFLSLIDKTASYVKVDLTYDLESNSGWLDYKNNLNTSIVSTCTEVGTLRGVVDIIAAILDETSLDVTSCCP
jgi:hypothetical protein